MESFALTHLDYFYIELNEHKISTMIAVPRADYLNYNTHLTIILSRDTSWNNRGAYLKKTTALWSEWNTPMEDPIIAPGLNAMLKH